MTQEALAELANAQVERATGRVGAMDADYVSKLERGIHRWPGKHYRRALREVLGATSDLDLGFYSTRSKAATGLRRDDTYDLPEPDARLRLGLAPGEEALKRRMAMGVGPAGAAGPAVFMSGQAAELEWSESGQAVGHAGVIEVPANTGLVLPWTAEGAMNAAAEILENSGMDRRVFLSLSGSALTEPAFEWLIALPAGDVAHPRGGRRVLDAHVDNLELMTDQLRRMDDQFGGGAVLGLVRNQVGYVLDLLRNYSYSESVGVRLHGAAAETLRLAGFLSFDAGRHAQAQRYWLAALRAAHAAGDRSIGANVLAFMSCQAKDLEMHNEAIKLSEAARQGYGGQCPRVSAIVNLRAAQAYASAREAKECRTAIDFAYDALRGQPSTSGEPAWCYWMNETVANEQVGSCYMRLDDWGRAQNHLQTALRLQADPVSREAALRLAKLATTYARQGDPEQACQEGGQAVDILAAKVDSERCVGHVRSLQAALSPYSKVAAVKDFNERVNRQFGVPA